LLQGRFINDGDGPSNPPVAVISAALSGSLYPDGAVGRTLLHQGNRVEIVGVVDDIRLTDIELEPEPMLFLPSAQKSPVRADHLLVRTAGDPRTVMPRVRAALGRFDPQLPLTEITSLSDRVDAATASRRFTLWLVLVFSVGAFVLALVGIYGVVAGWVEHRIPEIGVRMALGATAGSVVRLVLRHGGAMLAVGIGAGVIGASAVSRLTSQFVFEVSPTDPASIAGASLAVLAAGVGACLIPAARAARMDPAVALRQD
jgi:putative ABC transport system permease protein